MAQYIYISNGLSYRRPTAASVLGTYLSFLIKIQTLAICYFCITDISCAACSLIDEAIVSVKWNESGRHSTPQPTDPAGLRCHASKITLCVIDLPQTNKQMVLRVWEQTLLDLASQRYFLYGAFRRRVSCEPCFDSREGLLYMQPLRPFATLQKQETI